MRSLFTLFLFCSLFCSSSFLFSCSGSVKEILSDDSSCKELVADLKSDEYEEIDKILSIEDYIKLETKENCFIGTISKLIVTDSEIIVIDKKIANSV
ncbi:MAG: 6-bladed beta-propeller, partial [Bacteroidaceae bacterium]